MDENKDFRKELDELVNLFRKLRNKPSFKEIIGDSMELKAIDLLLENYDMIKDNIPEDVLNSLGENIKAMIKQINEDLKEDIEEAELLGKFNEPENKNSEEIDISASDLKEIDDLLKNSDKLSDEEIDKLLDKRNNIQTFKL